jgi:hypothetical protein
MVKFRHRVEGDRVFFRRLIAAAFFGHDMQELRAFQVAHVLQRIDQTQYVVAVHRANVVKAQLFKQRARHHHAFDMFFGTFGSSLIGGTPEKTFLPPSRSVE